MIKLLILILSALVVLPHPVSGQTTSTYAIQVETFKEPQKAVKKTESLKKKGLEAFWRETRPTGKAASTSSTSGAMNPGTRLRKKPDD